MKTLTRNALLGAAGLVAVSLPAHAVGSARVANVPLVKSNTAQQQLAESSQGQYYPSDGRVTFKKQKPKKTGQQQSNNPSASSVSSKKTKN